LKHLRGALDMLARARLSPALARAGAEAGASYRAAAAWAAARGATVYGLTTFPGHLADRAERPDPARFCADLLASHAIGAPPWFSARETRAITLAKVHAAAPGATLLTEATYNAIVAAFHDPAFAPEIPRHASYSSGDVIAGAHWARALLAHSPEGVGLAPGEPMALINGAFVHVGAAMALVAPLREAWLAYLEAARRSLRHLDAHIALPACEAPKWMRASVAHLFSTGAANTAQRRVQPPVSVRALPQSIDAAAWAVQGYLSAIDRALAEPSGNPLWTTLELRPSGSFVAPGLSLAAGGLIDSLLMLAWLCVRRIEHFVSARAGGAAPVDQAFALVQAPKLALAHLERMRRAHAARVFVSGGAVSEGVEDFWTHGLEVNDALRLALEDLQRLVALERAIGLSLERSYPARDPEAPLEGLFPV